MSPRRGFTLIELLMALMLASVLGAIVTKTLVAVSRFYAQDHGQRTARTVSRGAVSLLESELRMIDPSGGVVSADSTSITLRVPFASGILCTSGSGTGTASILPVDSLAWANAAFGGYAVRDSGYATTIVESGVTLGTGTSATCTSASITTLAGGRLVTVSTAPGALFPVGTPITLLQRVTYRFGASVTLPGRMALWRDLPATGLSEELVAPFDATARFRFYVLDADTAQAAAPASLANLRGIELVLNGASERTAPGNAGPETAWYTTAVFFRNRRS